MTRARVHGGHLLPAPKRVGVSVVSCCFLSRPADHMKAEPLTLKIFRSFSTELCVPAGSAGCIFVNQPVILLLKLSSDRLRLLSIFISSRSRQVQRLDETEWKVKGHRASFVGLCWSGPGWEPVDQCQTHFQCWNLLETLRTSAGRTFLRGTARDGSEGRRAVTEGVFRPLGGSSETAGTKVLPLMCRFGDVGDEVEPWMKVSGAVDGFSSQG